MYKLIIRLENISFISRCVTIPDEGLKSYRLSVYGLLGRGPRSILCYSRSGTIKIPAVTQDRPQILQSYPKNRLNLVRRLILQARGCQGPTLR